MKEEPSRREFLRGAALAAVGASVGIGCEKKPDSEREERKESEREESNFEAPKPIEEFRDLRSGVLVLAANESEKAAVLQTMHDRNQKRHRDAKFVFEERGQIHRAATHVRDYADRDRSRSRQQPLNEVPVIILTFEDLADSDVTRRLQDEAFHLVQLRGHTGDMEQLHDAALPYMADESLLVLGGCVGTQFIKDFYTPERPVIADQGIGESAVNTYILIRLIDEIGVSENWEDLYGKISESGDIEQMGLVMPGDPEYENKY